MLPFVFRTSSPRNTLCSSIHGGVMDQKDWETHYRALLTEGVEPTSGRPDPLVEQIAITLPPARALDLACGAGANALWLAEHGWDVTAVDRSPAAIELVRTQADRRGVKVAAHAADLEAHEFEIEPGAWNLILMCRYLQRDLFEPAKLGLAPGGVLIAIALLAEPVPEESEMAAAKPQRFPPQRFRVQPSELAAYFSRSHGWTILHQREALYPAGGSSQRHPVAEIAVQRDPAEKLR